MDKWEYLNSDKEMFCNKIKESKKDMLSKMLFGEVYAIDNLYTKLKWKDDWGQVVKAWTIIKDELI